MKEVFFHDEASAELEASVEFYESRLKDLGLRLSAAVESAVERISALPGSGSPLNGSLKKVIVIGFLHSIIYGDTGAHILLVPVAHYYRHLGYWEHRTSAG